MSLRNGTKDDRWRGGTRRFTLEAPDALLFCALLDFSGPRVPENPLPIARAELPIRAQLLSLQRGMFAVVRGHPW